jgi:hypothetical protein
VTGIEAVSFGAMLAVRSSTLSCHLALHAVWPPCQPADAVHRRS